MKRVLSSESFHSVLNKPSIWTGDWSHSYSRILTPLHNGLIENRVQTRWGRVSCVSGLLVWNYDELWTMDNEQRDKRTFLAPWDRRHQLASASIRTLPQIIPAPCRHFSVCHNLNSHEYLLLREGNITDDKIQNIYTNISISWRTLLELQTNLREDFTIIGWLLKPPIALALAS